MSSPRPDLLPFSAYDIVLVNSSAGKDSQAMLDRVVELVDAAGESRDKIVVVHADLGRVEWKGTRDLAEEQAKHYGLRFEVVRRQGRIFRGRELTDLLDHVRQMRFWPRSSTRYCTSDHKRDQVGRLITQLSREVREQHPDRHVRILQCLGIRAEESPRRAKMPDLRIDARRSNRSRTVHLWLPIHDWTAEQVWARIGASGVRHHIAYDLGMPRLSCCFCIFAPKPALVLAGKHNPELLDAYVEVEEEIGHTFRLDCSMASVREAVRAGEAETLSADDLGAGDWNM